MKQECCVEELPGDFVVQIIGKAGDFEGDRNVDGGLRYINMQLGCYRLRWSYYIFFDKKKQAERKQRKNKHADQDSFYYIYSIVQILAPSRVHSIVFHLD